MTSHGRVIAALEALENHTGSVGAITAESLDLRRAVELVEYPCTNLTEVWVLGQQIAAGVRERTHTMPYMMRQDIYAKTDVLLAALRAALDDLL